LREALLGDVPSLIRYPSGSQNEVVADHFYKDGFDGKISIRRDFSAKDMPDNIIITHGRIAAECIKAKKLLEGSGISVGIVLCEYIAPYESLSDEIAAIFDDKLPENLIFVEEEIKNGGFGMTLSEHLKNKINYEKVRFDIFAAENAFVERRVGESYLEASRLDAKSIAERIRSL
jgi:deoxyxylulose-5-phosphate synthase